MSKFCSGKKLVANWRKGVVVSLLLSSAFVGLHLKSNAVKYSIGNTSLPPASQRLVSLAPSLTETMCCLGLQNRLAAISSCDDYPPEILHLPRLDNLHPDWEYLLALEPQAVLVEDTICNDALKKRLHSLGLPIVNVKTEYLSDLPRNLTYLGQQLGCSKNAEQVRRELEQELLLFTKKSQTLRYHPRVFVDVYHSPLITAGSPSLMQELLELAGGNNIFADLSQSYPTVSAEELLQRDPDIVILTSLSADEAQGHPLLAKLRAVQNKHILVIDPNLVHRPTPRSLQGVHIMQDYFERWNEEQR